MIKNMRVSLFFIITVLYLCNVNNNTSGDKKISAASVYEIIQSRYRVP